MENPIVIPADSPLAAVQQGLEGQVAAWNAGDLERAMAFYWNSPQMLWINRNGVERGYAPVLEMFEKDFQDRSTMGEYTFTPLHLEQLAEDAVLYVFRWKIELDGKQLMGSVSSQVWKRIKETWVITSEHAS